jgi:hypothetical protein
MSPQVFIEVTNPGEIETLSMLLIGASTKRDDHSKIGFFGSGLKYAIAVLMREQIPFRIFSGAKEIKVKAKTVEFRGKQFGQISIDGKATSLTTEMGIDWEPWFALREILCNAIDEGDHTIDVVDAASPEEGKTKFYIEMTSKMSAVFASWDKFFSEKRADAQLTVGKCKAFYGGDDLIAYRKGIRCHFEQRKCLYNYDMDWATINESRVLASEWDFRYNLVQWIARNADDAMVRNIFDNYRDTFEEQLDWGYCVQFSDAWLSIIGTRPLVARDVAGYFTEDIQSCIVLPATLVRALKDTFKEKIHVKGMSDDYGSRIILDKTARQSQIIDEVLAFLRKVGVEIVYPIDVCHFQSNITLGQAANDIIYLSPNVFDMGKRQVCMTLVEEYSHLKSQSPDKSRSFQDFLISQFVASLEEKAGVYL